MDENANRMDLKETDEFKEYGFQVVNCPVCGRETLDSHWVCDYCGWEYDGIFDEDSYSSLIKQPYGNIGMGKINENNENESHIEILKKRRKAKC